MRQKTCLNSSNGEYSFIPYLLSSPISFSPFIFSLFFSLALCSYDKVPQYQNILIRFFFFSEFLSTPESYMARNEHKYNINSNVIESAGKSEKLLLYIDMYIVYRILYVYIVWAQACNIIYILALEIHQANSSGIFLVKLLHFSYYNGATKLLELAGNKPNNHVFQFNFHIFQQQPMYQSSHTHTHTFEWVVKFLMAFHAVYYSSSLRSTLSFTS